MAVGDRDRARSLRPVIRHPARHQPIGGVERGGIEGGEVVSAVARQPPQHCVDEAGIARGVAVGLDQAHGEVDGSVVRHFEPEDLCGADQQGDFDPGCVGGKAAREPAAEEMAQRTEPAQRRRHQGAHQRPVAIRQGGKLRMRRAVLELLVERPAAAQDAVEDIGGDAPRGKAGRVNAGCARDRALDGQERHPRLVVIRRRAVLSPARQRLQRMGYLSRKRAMLDRGPECT